MAKNATFDRWLAELRAEISAQPRGFKTHLARNLDLHPTQVTRIAKGEIERPSPTLHRVARTLHLIPPAHLYSRRERQMLTILREVEKHCGARIAEAFAANTMAAGEGLVEVAIGQKIGRGKSGTEPDKGRGGNR